MFGLLIHGPDTRSDKKLYQVAIYSEISLLEADVNLIKMTEANKASASCSMSLI